MKRVIKTELIIWRILFVALFLSGCFLVLLFENNETGATERESIVPLYKMYVVDSSDYVDNHVLENALDGNAVDDYAVLENTNDEIYFTLRLNEPLPAYKLLINWGDGNNLADKYVVSLYNSGRLIKTLSFSSPISRTIILNEGNKLLEIDGLKVELVGIQRQEEVMIRQIALLPPAESILERVENIKINSSDTVEQICNKLREITRCVNSLLVYGLGPEVNGGNPDEEELLEYGEGHCGSYAYLLNKYLAMKGIECQTVDITSRNQGGHSIVEVHVNGNYFVLDPTLNLLYKSNIQNLVNNGIVYSGELYIEYGWGDNYFLKNAYNIKYYMDVCDAYDFDVLKKLRYKIKSNLQEKHMPVGMNAEMKECDKLFMTFEFEEPIEFYRIKLWFGQDGFNGKITVVLNSEDQEADEIHDGLVWETHFRKMVSAKNVTLIFDSLNNTEPVIESLSIYR